MSDPIDDSADLRHLAILYAAGEMDAAAASAFEDRLLDDELAQDALVQTVQLGALLNGPTRKPSTAYRDQVRAAVGRRSWWRQWLPTRFQSRPFRFVAAGAGCAVALALIALWVKPAPNGEESPVSLAANNSDSEDSPGPGTGLQTVLAALPDDAVEASDDDMLEMAEAWAEMSTSGEHLAKTLEDSQQRRRFRWRLDDIRLRNVHDVPFQPE